MLRFFSHTFNHEMTKFSTQIKIFGLNVTRKWFIKLGSIIFIYKIWEISKQQIKLFNSLYVDINTIN